VARRAAGNSADWSGDASSSARLSMTRTEDTLASSFIPARVRAQARRAARCILHPFPTLMYNSRHETQQLVAAVPSLDTPPHSDPDITLITADSRKVIPGALFVAYPGVSVDGHRFIPEAIERGGGHHRRKRFNRRGRKARELSTTNSAASAFSAVNIPYLKVRDGREAFAGSTPRVRLPRAQVDRDRRHRHRRQNDDEQSHSCDSHVGGHQGRIDQHGQRGDRQSGCWTPACTRHTRCRRVQRYLAEMVDAA